MKLYDTYLQGNNTFSSLKGNIFPKSKQTTERMVFINDEILNTIEMQDGWLWLTGNYYQ